MGAGSSRCERGVALSFDARNLSFYSFSGPERAEAE